MTEGELLAAIEAAWQARLGFGKAADDSGAQTVAEIAEATGAHENKIRKAINKGIRTGTWEHVKLPKLQMDGTVRRRPHYRPKTAGADG